MVKIRLKRAGKKKAPFYHVVIADSRTARDGKVIEKIGTYDPMTTPSTVNIDLAKVDTWVKNGAQATDVVKKLIAIAKGEKKYVAKPKKEEVKVENKKEEILEENTEETNTEN